MRIRSLGLAVALLAAVGCGGNELAVQGAGQPAYGGQQAVTTRGGQIPPGTTVSYAKIATRIGSPKAVRAVAQACAANHIAVAIPCHRVVRRDGKLAGYRWGVERKRELLRREART